MIDMVLLQLAEAIPALTTVYWIAMITFGGLVVISTISGSHGDGAGDFDVDAHAGFDVDAHADFDADVSADVDFHAPGDVDAAGHLDADVHAGHAEVTSLTTWLSVRFLVFFGAVFGVVGVVLTHLTDYSPWTTLGCALVGGFLIGQGVHQLFRKLRESSGNTALTVQDYLNKPARVSITITYPKKGEIAVKVRSGERFLPAISKRADTSFAVGEQVAIVDYHGGIAEVVSREEFEFLTNKS